MASFFTSLVAMQCGARNCSGHGVCMNGSCYCQIQFEGNECRKINFSYHVAFASIFFVLALTSLIQLVMCIHAEYLRMKKNPSLVRACRITTQKLLYLSVFVASLLRGIYFAAPTMGNGWSASLMTAYYPVVLTGNSLIVCFWAEVFHLREISWERPRFLSKSFIGFVVFNVISYSLLMAELLLVWTEHQEREFYAHIFNGCYAFLMFVVVVFFLIYGVEVFFKVRGGFTVSAFPHLINSRSHQDREHHLPSQPASSAAASALIVTDTKSASAQPSKDEITTLLSNKINGLDPVTQQHEINTSQLNQSRLGLLSQAFMMMITVGFLFSETLEEFWKAKVDLSSRNTHDVVFRTIEIGIALWFPCVLWNCIRPEQLWCLNPKKILEKLPPALKDVRLCEPKSIKKAEGLHCDGEGQDVPCSESGDEEDKGQECWICYDSDRTDAGPMIYPCDCRGDVGAVHHDCLRRWLLESADNPETFKCKVCSATYMVEKGSQFSLAQGFTTKQWLQTTSIVTVMCVTLGGCWALVQIYYEPWIRAVAVSGTLLIHYICLRFLGLNTLSAYQRAKVQALKIVNLRIRNSGNACSDRISSQVADPVQEPTISCVQVEPPQSSQ